jgi:TatD DNase family protein
MLLFDSHCHIDFAAFDSDRAELWARCNRLGIEGLVIPGVNPAQWLTAAALCEQYSGFYFAAGLHPHWINQQPWFSPGTLLDDHSQAQIYQQLTAQLIPQSVAQSVPQSIATLHGERALAAQKKRCVAVGETGLDKLINVPLVLQQQLLQLHIMVANEYQMPLIVHSVKTHNEILACFKQMPPRYGGVIHAFSGSLETAQQFIAQGFLLGVGGTITYERAKKTRATFSKIPLQYLLLETDAPDMPLSGKQGERNSPEYLPQIAQQLAQLQGVSVEQVAEVTTCNAQRLFGLPE